MAERRMFAKTIIDSDAFLDMSLSTQALYFHLSMRADDDGFVNNPKKIQRMIGSGDDELKMLIAKRFIIPFESGICVIKHWRMHNYIRNDRYKETVYTEEKSKLFIEENKAYTLEQSEDTKCIPNVSKTETKGKPTVYQEDTKEKEINDTKYVKNAVDTDVSTGEVVGIPNGNQVDTQVRLGKDSIGKSRVGEDRIEDSLEEDKETKLPPLSFPNEISEKIYNFVGDTGYKTWFINSDIKEEESYISIKANDDFKRGIIISKYIPMLQLELNKRIEVS